MTDLQPIGDAVCWAVQTLDLDNPDAEWVTTPPVRLAYGDHTDPNGIAENLAHQPDDSRRFTFHHLDRGRIAVWLDPTAEVLFVHDPPEPDGLYEVTQ